MTRSVVASEELRERAAGAADAARPRRTKRLLPRFGLRALFVFALAFCLVFGWIGRNLYRVRQEAAAVETLKRAGATVLVRVEWGPREHPATVPDAGAFGGREDPPSWLGRALGVADPRPVDEVVLNGESDGPAQREALEALAAFPELETVRIYGEAFADESLAPLARLPKLRDLTIARTHVSREGLAKLAPAAGLRRLTLGELAGEAEIVSGVSSLPQLRELHLYSLDVSQANVDAAASLPKLDSFHLGDAALASGDVFAPLVGSASLREFGLSLSPRSRPLTEDDARSIARTPNLKVLVLSRFDTALLAPFLETGSLRVLRLYGGPDDRAAGQNFSAQRPGCLVECAGTASPAAFYLGGREIESEAAEKRLQELETR